MTVEEYNRTVDLWADRLYRFAVKLCKQDEHLARDFVQEAFLRLWQRHKDVQAPAARAYLFTSINRLLIDHWRKHRRMDLYDTVPDQNITEDPAARTSKLLDVALTQLPDIQRIVVLLRDYESLTYAEIGQMTGLSEAQVKVYIYRARRALKNFLTAKGISA